MKAKAPSARAKLIATVPRVSAVLRKLAPLMSQEPARDAFFHMEIGQALLADGLIPTRRVYGFAAWRVGPGDGDILSYHPSALGWLPQSPESLPYQPWLEVEDMIIDFTTYQFEQRAKALDVVDGRTTCVDWFPRYLLIPRSEVRSLRRVTDAMHSGVVYYQEVPELNRVVDPGTPPDDSTLQKARALFDTVDLAVPDDPA